MITGRQIRAARALLEWKAEDLAREAGLTRVTISKIESDLVQPQEKTVAHIIKVFNEQGVEFIENQGVRFKPKSVEVLEGLLGFTRFYELVFEHLLTHGGNVCVNGVDERMFEKYRPAGDVHRIRMTDLAKKKKDFKMQILVREGDYHFTATAYAKYRWQSREYFSPTPFYVFGDCLALISFSHEPAPLVIVIQSAPFAEAYRQSFNFAWSNSKPPPDTETNN